MWWSSGIYGDEGEGEIQIEGEGKGDGRGGLTYL